MEARSPQELPEKVVLLDSRGTACGTMEKSLVHGRHTPLHRAFSIFLINEQRQLLVQQRSLTKLTWPGIWSNSCCGHPAPGEMDEAAASRRLKEELGVEGIHLHLVLPFFRYTAIYQDVMENEVCPVFVGICRSDTQFKPEHKEVESIDWVSLQDFFASCQNPENTRFERFSPWSLLEGRLLRASTKMKQILLKLECDLNLEMVEEVSA